MNLCSIFGDRNPLREFLHVDDLSNAVEFLLDKNPDEELINVGSGEEISIANLANLIKEVLRYDGKLIFDEKMPDGNPRKLIDSTLINSMGWKARISLEDGIKNTYDWFLENC